MFELAEVRARDGALLQGLTADSRRKRLAVIYVHGFAGDFYGSPAKTRAFASACRRKGFGLFAFNNRGNNVVSGLKKADRSRKGYSYSKGGCCYEHFEDCLLDIDAVVREAQRKGYRKVALIGHSTGANKVVYYLSRRPSRAVARAVLTGPVSDVPLQVMHAGPRYRALLKHARRMVSRRKGDSLMPPSTPLWPLTARRFLSLSVAGSPEDVFQYHMERPDFRALRKVKVPVLAVLGGKDEYATSPPEDILRSYREANPLVESMIIEDSPHSFRGSEELLAGMICGWLDK